MEAENHLWSLIAKKLSCEATDQKLAELELLLNSNKELLNIVNILTHMWETPLQYSEIDIKVLEEKFNILQQKLKI